MKTMSVRIAAEKEIKSHYKSKWDDFTEDRKQTLINRLLSTTCVRRIKGAAILKTPEQRLFFAVIEKAILESWHDKDYLRGGARMYFRKGNHEFHAGACGLDVEFVDRTLSEFLEWANTDG